MTGGPPPTRVRLRPWALRRRVRGWRSGDVLGEAASGESVAVPEAAPASDQSAAGPPAGWYPDPASPDALRLWDGGAWTGRTAPVPSAPTGTGSWGAAPPPRRGRTGIAVAVALAVVGGLVAAVGLGAFALVRGLGGMVRTGGHPEMARELERTGLGDAFAGRGVVLDGNRLGIDRPARVLETLEAPGAVPYDRVGALLGATGWAPAPCAFPRDPAERCWVKASPERRATAYELTVQPGEPGPGGVVFDVEVSELPPAQAERVTG